MRFLQLLAVLVALSSAAQDAPLVAPIRSGETLEDSVVLEEDTLGQTGDAEEPCLVIAGTRHGSRYPLSGHEWPNQAAWPAKSSKFWDHNAGQMTVQGVKNMQEIGAKIGGRYPHIFLDNRNMKIFADSA